MKFCRDENGSVTIEFVLWLPLALYLVVMAVDATFAFLGLTNMWQVSRETARVMSRYGMSEADAEAQAATSGTFLGITPTVSIAYNSGDVVVAMSMPAQGLTPFGVFGFTSSTNITTVVSHAMEPQ